RDAEAAGGLEVDVRGRLAAPGLLRGDRRGEVARQPRQLEDEVDDLAVGGGGQAEWPARGERRDGLAGAVDERQVLAVAALEPRDDGPVDLLGRQVDAELLVDVARPLRRAHPHHRLGRPGPPGAAALADDLAPRSVP